MAVCVGIPTHRLWEDIDFSGFVFPFLFCLEVHHHITSADATRNADRHGEKVASLRLQSGLVDMDTCTPQELSVTRVVRKNEANVCVFAEFFTRTLVYVAGYIYGGPH